MTGSIGSYSNVSGIDGKKIADDNNTPTNNVVGCERSNKVKEAKKEVDNQF